MARANLTVAETAKVLGLDKQSVRIMIQMGIVDWGKCWKRPGSTQYSYLISPKKFFEDTGIMLGGLADGDN